MASLLAIGECMIELYETANNTYHRSFAGDTFNSAVYTKRWNSSIAVSYLTALGTDHLSDEILKQCEDEGINQSLIFRSPSEQPGIYIISTDKLGERNFAYWRRQSAAKQMMLLFNEHINVESLDTFDVVYFSGISLAILSDEDKGKLLDLIISLRNRGTKVAFDPNFRAGMWNNLNHAKRWFNRAYQTCDIALPGLDDHLALFGHKTKEDIREFLINLGVHEVVIKCGENGVFCYDIDSNHFHLPFIAAKMQVDSTAAGDAFSGTYLASRINGENISVALNAAAKVSRLVVQHQGAIMERSTYNANLTSEKNCLIS